MRGWFGGLFSGGEAIRETWDLAGVGTMIHLAGASGLAAHVWALILREWEAGQSVEMAGLLFLGTRKPLLLALTGWTPLTAFYGGLGIGPVDRVESRSRRRRWWWGGFCLAREPLFDATARPNLTERLRWPFLLVPHSFSLPSGILRPQSHPLQCKRPRFRRVALPGSLDRPSDRPVL